MANEVFISKESKWYVLHTFHSYEAVAKENLEQAMENDEVLRERISDIVIPTEDVIEETNGKKKLVTRKSMPCYIFVKMIYGDDIWHKITHTRGITGFVGPKGRPLPLTDEEIRKIGLEKVPVDFTLGEGDQIEIISGSLIGTVCTVISADNETQKCKVNVSMFGRDTPVELSFNDVKKIQ
ncbi:MAG: transcription termination/antitermination factor NusG [Clostridia bacterium]|nr:transcription termination/antitermination factor NusG [Clostridia bacterium]